MKTISLSILVVFYSLIALCHSSNALNLAYQKTYTLSPAPNYSLTAPATDRNLLVDGKYSSGFFWTQKSTAGWHHEKHVEILIDLGKISDIGSLTFNTARSQGAEVYFPAHVFAFIGSDMNHFSYVGDVVESSDNAPGPYKVQRFTLAGLKARGRYVLLKAAARGNSLFCDEIEVLAPDGGATAMRVAQNRMSRASAIELDMEATRKHAILLEQSDLQNKFLRILLKEITASSGVLGGEVQNGGIGQSRAASVALDDYAAGETNILRLRGTALRARFPGKQFLLEAYNPWKPLTPGYRPSGISTGEISLILSPKGGDYAAFVLTNLSTEPKRFTLSFQKWAAGAPKLSIFSVPFVRSDAMEYVADPLVPLPDSFNLRSGESKMIFLAAQGLHPGKWQSTLKVAVGADIKSLLLNLQVSNVTLPAKSSLNSVNWGYLDFKPIRDQKSAAVKDLFDHHTNTIVIPPAYLPFAYPTKPHDVVRLDKYLQLHKGASKVLLFTHFNNNSLLTSNGKYPFMSTEWKNVFRKFYGGLVKSAETAGFSEDQLYMYPFDEMKGKEIDQFIALASWAHKEIPAIKFYATLDNKGSFRSMPYLDIAQVINRGDLFSEVIGSKKEIWLYGAEENTKSLSPYSYYRLMSWQAFYRGFKGVGFWNYADTGSGENPGRAWDDFDGKRPDCAVIYEGEKGTIISSRRWEAWRMGVEDYELLAMYAKAKGAKSAKELAKSVLNNPLDVGKADEVRRKILRELAQ